MTNPTDLAPMKRDWTLIVAVVLVAASTVIASFTAQAGLGELAGWTAFVSISRVDLDLHLSWLLPLTVDAYGVGATRIATNKQRYSAEVRRHAFGHALAAVAVSVLANSVYHLIEARVIVLGTTAWVLVVAVSIVPPVALGGLAHLLSVAARDEVEVVEVVVPAVPEPVLAALATVGVRPTVEPERIGEPPAVDLNSHRTAVETVAVPAVPEPVPPVLPTVADLRQSHREESPSEAESEITSADRHSLAPAVPDLFAGVPPQLSDQAAINSLGEGDTVNEPPFSDQVQPDRAAELDAPYYPLALTHFLSDVVQGEPPTVRAIKDQMSVGTDRARRLQSYLGGLVKVAR